MMGSVKPRSRKARPRLRRKVVEPPSFKPPVVATSGVEDFMAKNSNYV